MLTATTCYYLLPSARLQLCASAASLAAVGRPLRGGGCEGEGAGRNRRRRVHSRRVARQARAADRGVEGGAPKEAAGEGHPCIADACSSSSARGFLACLSSGVLVGREHRNASRGSALPRRRACPFGSAGVRKVRVSVICPLSAGSPVWAAARSGLDGIPAKSTISCTKASSRASRRNTVSFHARFRRNSRLLPSDTLWCRLFAVFAGTPLLGGARVASHARVASGGVVPGQSRCS